MNSPALEDSQAEMPTKSSVSNTVWTQEFYEGLRRELFAFCFHTLNFDAPERLQRADDAVSEAFLRLFQQTDPIDNIKGWLFRVAQNYLRDQARKSDLKKRVHIDVGSGELLLAMTQVPECRHLKSEALRKLRIVIDRVLATQTDYRQQVFRLRMRGLSSSQISETLGRKVAAIDMTFSRVVDAIKIHIDKFHGSLFDEFQELFRDDED